MKSMNKQLRISLFFQSFYRRTYRGHQGDNSPMGYGSVQSKLASLVTVYLRLNICKLYHDPKYLGLLI